MVGPHPWNALRDRVAELGRGKVQANWLANRDCNNPGPAGSAKVMGGQRFGQWQDAPDTYVSGHGDLFTKNDVRTKLAFIQDKWDRMKAMVAQGKSLDEIEEVTPEHGTRASPPPHGSIRNDPAGIPACCSQIGC